MENQASNGQPAEVTRVEEHSSCWKIEFAVDELLRLFQTRVSSRLDIEGVSLDIFVKAANWLAPDGTFTFDIYAEAALPPQPQSPSGPLAPNGSLEQTRQEEQFSDELRAWETSKEELQRNNFEVQGVQSTFYVTNDEGVLHGELNRPTFQ